MRQANFIRGCCDLGEFPAGALESSSPMQTLCQLVPLLGQNQWEKYLYYVCTYTKNGTYTPVCQKPIPCAESAPQRLADSNRNQTSFPDMQDRSFPLFNSPYSSFHFLKILHKLRYWKMQIIKDGLRFFSSTRLFL